MLFLSSSITELKLDTSGQILMQRSLKQLLSTTIRDSPCARSQAGRGRVLRADIAGAAAAYSTKTENDLHAHRKALFFCLLLHLNQQYWLLLSEVVLPMKPCQEMI
jgi:hypothetical protein